MAKTLLYAVIFLKKYHYIAVRILKISELVAELEGHFVGISAFRSELVRYRGALCGTAYYPVVLVAGGGWG